LEQRGGGAAKQIEKETEAETEKRQCLVAAVLYREVSTREQL
jgi:hypothetical protein